jgi:hypothetical protein
MRAQTTQRCGFYAHRVLTEEGNPPSVTRASPRRSRALSASAAPRRPGVAIGTAVVIRAAAGPVMAHRSAIAVPA